MSATVYLTRLWIHDAANLADNLDVFVLDESETWASNVETRRYAGGRFRTISGPGTARVVPLRLRSVSRFEYTRLCALVNEGKPVLVRLPRGRKLWGTIASVSSVEHLLVDRLEQVTITVSEFSHSEHVA